MVISKAREYDRAVRLCLLEIIGVCLRAGRTDDAITFGMESARLKKRIATHDYRKEDTDYALTDRLNYRWNQISKGII